MEAEPLTLRMEDDMNAPVYEEYRPPARDFFDLPRAPLYTAMGATIVLVVAYAIVGHLIKDLLHHCLDCTLGPHEEDLKESNERNVKSCSYVPTPLPLSHTNAFRLWNQDDVVIPLSPELGPQSSPLLAVMPYIPYFFNSPPLPYPYADLAHLHPPHMNLLNSQLHHTIRPLPHQPHTYLPHSQLSPIWSPIKMPQEIFF